MENITELFNDIYTARKALVVYQSDKNDAGVYVEAYDINSKGMPMNAHPLTLQETVALADCFNASAEININYLKSKGLMPDNVLQVNPDRTGSVLWYTKPQKVPMFFTEDLGIASGGAYVPALLWKATKKSLYIYSLVINGKPDVHAPLYAAPFFNIHEDGLVCMGTVDIEAEKASCLEDFIQAWESYFWNSHFSHLIGERSPVNANIVLLWQEQINTDRKFPTEVLIRKGKQLKDLL